MRDIEESTVILGGGLEYFGEDEAYMSDMVFGYLGYAPFRWLEAGIALHNLTFGFYPSIDGKVDLMEFFSDSARLSCMVMAGIGGIPKDPDYPIFLHGGVAVNYRVARWLQLYVGVGSDSVATALAVQAGIHLAPLQWLGASVNFKMAVGREGVEPMISGAPMFVIPLE
jgi:hypothetical protein